MILIGMFAMRQAFSGGGGPPDPPVGDVISLTATGSEVNVTVPAGKYGARAYLIGASAGAGIYNSGQKSGAGGYTVGSFAVTPGEVLKARTGVGGKAPVENVAGGLGGWPGGGSGSRGDTFGGGGGGYSGLFRADGSPIFVAGGGGAGAGYSTAPGNGGGLNGGNGTGSSGATQSSGGTGAYPGSPYQGGNADNGNRTVNTNNDGGGGGGGYYGGAAPAGDGTSAGGGSGFVHPDAKEAATYLSGTQGTRPGAIPATIAGISTSDYGQGVNSANRGSVAPDGKDGLIVIEFFDEAPTDNPYDVGTWSQSAVYGSLPAASKSNLTDVDGDANNCTGTGTPSSSQSWIKLDFGESKSIGKAIVGAGTLPGFGGTAFYLNGALLQYSNNDADWTTAVTIADLTDVEPIVKEFTFTPVSARYWRIFKTDSYLGITTFKLRPA